MCTITCVRWIANAAARFSGTHGAVSSQARRADCSRQTIYDQARKVQDAVEAEHSGGPSRQQILEQNQALRQENAQLRSRLNHAVEFPQAKQQEFAAHARAMGLSLNQIAALLMVFLGAKQAPARSTQFQSSVFSRRRASISRINCWREGPGEDSASTAAWTLRA